MAKPNERIVRYLKDHKDKFDIDILKKELSKAGFSHEEIEEAEESLDEDKRDFDEITPFPDPVFEEIRKEAREWKKDKKEIKNRDKTLDKLEIFMIFLVIVLIATFIYILLV